MILVDTHVVVWLAFDEGQISRKARAVIDDARKNGDGLAISDITFLKLGTLTSKGRIRLNISLESFLREVETRFVVLPISGCACVPLDFQRLIPKIPRIALSEQPRWPRGCLCLLRIVRSVGPKRFPRFGEKSVRDAA